MEELNKCIVTTCRENGKIYAYLEGKPLCYCRAHKNLFWEFLAIWYDSQGSLANNKKRLKHISNVKKRRRTKKFNKKFFFNKFEKVKKNEIEHDRAKYRRKWILQSYKTVGSCTARGGRRTKAGLAKKRWLGDARE